MGQCCAFGDSPTRNIEGLFHLSIHGAPDGSSASGICSTLPPYHPTSPVSVALGRAHQSSVRGLRSSDDTPPADLDAGGRCQSDSIDRSVGGVSRVGAAYLPVPVSSRVWVLVRIPLVRVTAKPQGFEGLEGDINKPPLASAVLGVVFEKRRQ